MIYIFSYFCGKNYNDEKYVYDWYTNLKQYYCVDNERKFIIYTDNEKIKENMITYNDVKIFIIKSIDDKNFRLLMKFNLIKMFLNRNTFKENDIFSMV
jgi:hypothetical protein